MRLGMIGYGTVGQGVADLLRRHARLYERRAGQPLSLDALLVRNTDRPRDIPPPDAALFTDEPDDFFNADFDILIEVAGGIHPAHEHVVRALDSGRDVVTANKALIAKCAPALFPRAEKQRRRLAFEAAVAGGLPIIDTLTTGLAANRIHTITAIPNATCNFILSRMVEESCGYPAALAAAKARGYAEADPSLDISGRDAAEKLAILASLAFDAPVDPDHIPTRGLDDIELEDIHVANAMGYALKLVARAHRSTDPDADPAASLRVAPTLVPLAHPLADVRGPQLAAILEADAVPRTLMVADAAGRHPTASAVVADVINLTRLHASRDATLNRWPVGADPLPLAPPDALDERAYLRLHVLHHENAYENLRAHLAENDITIDTLHETQHTLAVVTAPAPHDAIARLAADPISTAFDKDNRVTLPVLEHA